VASFDGSKVIASNGMTATIKTVNENLQSAEFVFILGSWGTEHYQNHKLTAWLRKRARAGERICGVELGSYIVARAGLLDGKSATIHWSWLNGFKENFDRVEVEESLFTLDSKVMTCSGGLAGVDLMLRLIEEINGSSFSGEIADQMLHHPIRSAISPQRGTMGRSTETMRPLLREAMTLIENNIEEPLTVPQNCKSFRCFATPIGKAIQEKCWMHSSTIWFVEAFAKRALTAYFYRYEHPSNSHGFWI
jgi:AraC family carnitine catabolism transcriptional activator